jgi:hypothetical protein
MVRNSPFAGRRGEFVHIRHREQESRSGSNVLARIVSISRSNVLYNTGLGQAATELELPPGASRVNRRHLIVNFVGSSRNRVGGFWGS